MINTNGQFNNFYQSGYQQRPGAYAYAYQASRPAGESFWDRIKENIVQGFTAAADYLDYQIIMGKEKLFGNRGNPAVKNASPRKKRTYDFSVSPSAKKFIFPLAAVAALSFYGFRAYQKNKEMDFRASYAKQYMQTVYGRAFDMYEGDKITKAYEESPLSEMEQNLKKAVASEYPEVATTEPSLRDNFFRRMQHDESYREAVYEAASAVIEKKTVSEQSVLIKDDEKTAKVIPYNNSAVAAETPSPHATGIMRYFWQKVHLVSEGGKYMAPRSDHDHKGIDLYNAALPHGEAQIGQPVYAPADCFIKTWRMTTKGHTCEVILDDGHGNEFTYMHVYMYDEKDGNWPMFGFEPGTMIKAGQPFTRIHAKRPGESSEGPHLHFEWKHDGIQQDPAKLFDGQLPMSPGAPNFQYYATRSLNYATPVLPGDILQQENTFEKFDARLEDLKGLNATDVVNGRGRHFRYVSYAMTHEEEMQGAGHDKYADTKMDPVRDAILNKELELETGDIAYEPNGTVSKWGINSGRFGAMLKHRGLRVEDLTRIDAYNIMGHMIYDRLIKDDMTPAQKIWFMDAAVNQGEGFAADNYYAVDGDLKKFKELRQARYDYLVQKNPQKYGTYGGVWNDRMAIISQAAGDMEGLQASYAPKYAVANAKRDTTIDKKVAQDSKPDAPATPFKWFKKTEHYASTSYGQELKAHEKLRDRIYDIGFKNFLKLHEQEQKSLRQLTEKMKDNHFSISDAGEKDFIKQGQKSAYVPLDENRHDLTTSGQKLRVMSSLATIVNL